MKQRLHQLLERRLACFGLNPVDVLVRDVRDGLSTPGLASANRHCRLMRAKDGWIALNLAREDDRDIVPALTGRDGEVWSSLSIFCRTASALEVRDRAIELQLPVALLGESTPLVLARPGGKEVPRKVVDLSALWAGPLCTSLLSRAGAQVVRVESVGRRDPTPLTSPGLDQRINGCKARIELDLSSAAGRADVGALLESADAVVTSGRPAALARLGLTPSRFPHLAWVAITGHGFVAAGGQRVGFGDDCAVAGGLVDYENDVPHFMGDALADPLTGLEAAVMVLAGQRGVIDVPLARVAAAYAAMLA